MNKAKSFPVSGLDVIRTSAPKKEVDVAPTIKSFEDIDGSLASKGGMNPEVNAPINKILSKKLCSDVFGKPELERQFNEMVNIVAAENGEATRNVGLSRNGFDLTKSPGSGMKMK